MTEEEKAQIRQAIGERKHEPGIVLEWYQAEMERLYNLEMDKRYREEMAELQRRETIARNLAAEMKHREETAELKRDRAARAIAEQMKRRQEEYETAHPETLVSVSITPPAPAVKHRNAELEKERKYREYHEALDKITPEELKQLSAHLARYGRKFPKTARSLGKAIFGFRSFRETEADWQEDRRAYETYMPYESLWSVEMREYMRVAYIPFRIRDRPFSMMQECSIWTGANSMPSFIRKRVKARKLQAAEMSECGNAEETNS